MYKYIIFFILFQSTSIVIAGNLPKSLFQVEIGTSIEEIKNTNSTGMHLFYSIKADEKQLIEPLNMLSVRVDKESRRVQAIIGEAIIEDALCASEAQKLKAKYEQLFSLPFETREHKGDIHHSISENTRVFIVGCKNKRKQTILRVVLLDTSKELSIPKKQISTPISKAVSGPRKPLSEWSTDCDNVKKSRWFLLDHQGGNDYMLVICAGFKCIPYPGFWKPFDIYNDKKVKWVTDTEMKVSNNDKDAGWEGYITFNRCHKN